MVDIRFLKRRGVSSSAWKKVWTKDPSEYTPRQKKLVDLISGRIRDGYTNNLREHRAYYAVDLAYEVPFNQTTPTLIQNILSRKLDERGTLEELRKWGLSESELFLKVPMPDGREGRMLNPPVFFQIYIPIVKAYVTAILAQIYNERNASPLLPYKPLKETDFNRVLCEIITDAIDTQSTWYGYPAVMRQAIQQTLKYGIMLAFPREEWHCDRQIRENGTDEGEEYTVKEGLRYIHPHPTRMFYDLEFPLTSLNTNTGCRYAGHWHVRSYGSILDDRMLWNRKKIFAGTNWLASPLAGNYFQEVYPCTMQFIFGQQGPLNREDKMAWYNSTTDRDKAVFMTEYYMELIPKDWDLGDYKYPVWCHATVAGDDTILWFEPCAYVPTWFMGYDYDEQSAKTPSLGLELIPWQDHLGMILSQMLLTAKKNLAKIIFYDTEQVDKKEIEVLNNAGENLYRGVYFMPFSSFKNAAARLDHRGAFFPVELGQQPIQEMLQMIPTVLNIMQRVLGIAAQDMGAAATHQQSKEEVVRTGGSSTARIELINSNIDEGIDAWMRQLYAGHQAYADPNVEAEVDASIPDVEEHLKKAGFEIVGKSKDTLVVKGPKKNLLQLEGFAATYRGPELGKDKEASAIIMSTIATIAGQPDLHKEIGAHNLLKMIEFAAILGGAPRGFKLRMDLDAKKDEEVPEAILQAIQQAQAATLQAVEEKIAKPIAGEMAQDKQRLDQIDGVLKQLEKIYQVAAQTQDKNAIKAKESAAKIQLREAEVRADQQRKDQAAAAEQARKDKALLDELQRKNLQLQADLKAKEAELRVKLESDRAKNDAAIEAKKKASTPE